MPAPAEGEARWRALAELADLLGEEVYPADSFPAVCRWLAGTLDATVAIMLLTDDAIDQVAAWPADDHVAHDLAGLVGRPIDEQSTIWEAVCEGRPLTGGAEEPIAMPAGVTPDVGAWAVIPIIDQTVAFGALFIAQPLSDTLDPSAQALAEAVAERLARALFNCEEAANSGSSSDDQLPDPIRDRLGAVALVLGAVDAATASGLAPDQLREYQSIVEQAAVLQSQLERFLTGRGLKGRGGNHR
jgi:GAF domain-containing protein